MCHFASKTCDSSFSDFLRRVICDEQDDSDSECKHGPSYLFKGGPQHVIDTTLGSTALHLQTLYFIAAIFLDFGTGQHL